MSSFFSFGDCVVCPQLAKRKALIAKVNEKQSAINTDNEGTIEEKQKAIQSLNDAKNSADEQITQAASNQNVDNEIGRASCRERV